MKSAAVLATLVFAFAVLATVPAANAAAPCVLGAGAPPSTIRCQQAQQQLRCTYQGLGTYSCDFDGSVNGTPVWCHGYDVGPTPSDGYVCKVGGMWIGCVPTATPFMRCEVF